MTHTPFFLHRPGLILATALLIGLILLPASAHAASQSGTFKVMFVGNSHLFVNNVPSRVRRQLRSTVGPTTIRTFAFGGAQLSGFTRRSDVTRALKQTVWDVVVLQEATATFLTASGRRRFQKAVDWFRRKAPAKTRIVLFQTWPWRAGSRYLRGQGKSSAQLWQSIRSAYARAATGSRVVVAPVGACWQGSSRRATYYSSDGNHASLAGSRVAAAVIARTIKNGASGRC